MALFWKDIINRIIESCQTPPDHKIISIIQIFTTILIQITESCPKVHWSAHLWATASSSEFHTRARMSDAWRWREDHDGDQEGGEGDGDHGHVGGDYDVGGHLHLHLHHDHRHLD